MSEKERVTGPYINQSSSSPQRTYVFIIIQNFSVGQSDFECYEPSCSAPRLTVTKISTYSIYLYVIITVKTAPQLNRLFRTAQTVITIRSLKMIPHQVLLCLLFCFLLDSMCFSQCFESRPRPAVEPVNPVIQKKFGLDFAKNPIFRNPQKSTKIQNPIPVKPPVEPINNF